MFLEDKCLLERHFRRPVKRTLDHRLGQWCASRELACSGHHCRVEIFCGNNGGDQTHCECLIGPNDPPGQGEFSSSGETDEPWQQPSATEGKSLGFVNEVVESGRAVTVALEWANRIAANSPQSIRTSLDVVKRSLDIASLEDSINTAYDSVAELRAGPDFIEGPRAFAEKRKPNWSA